MEDKDSNVIVLHAPKDHVVTGSLRGVPETGHAIIRCRDIAGQCCTLCHDEADDGGRPLVGLTDNSDVVVALVCCRKQVEAEKRLAQPLVYRSKYLSFPKGKCERL